MVASSILPSQIVQLLKTYSDAWFSLEWISWADFLDCRECACWPLLVGAAVLSKVGVSFSLPICHAGKLLLFSTLRNTWHCCVLGVDQTTECEIVSHWNFNLHLSDNRCGYTSFHIWGAFLIPLSVIIISLVIIFLISFHLSLFNPPFKIEITKTVLTTTLEHARSWWQSTFRIILLILKSKY